ncbi:MAG TPA: alpha/beta fold hydrolase, partial [Terrimicrobiaceae bacterium]
SGEAPPEAAVLRRSLGERLPDYMVPSAFVMLEALPLTANGKLDRRALPAPKVTRTPVIESKNAVESELEKIWHTLLNVTEIGLDEDFFSLGGHSLMAVRVVSAIEKRWKVSIPIKIFMTTPTLRGVTREVIKGIGQSSEAPRSNDVSEMIDQLSAETSLSRLACASDDTTKGRRSTNLIARHGAKAWSPLVLIQKGGDLAPIFLIQGGGENYLVFRDLIKHLGEDVPFYILEARGSDGHLPPYNKLDELVREYEKAIRRAQKSGPYHLLGWCAGGLIAHEMAAQLERVGEDSVLFVVDTFPAPGDGDAPTAWRRILYHCRQIVGVSFPANVRYLVVYLTSRIQRVIREYWTRKMLNVFRLFRRPIPTRYREQQLHDAQTNFLREHVLSFRSGPMFAFWANEQALNPALVSEENEQPTSHPLEKTQQKQMFDQALAIACWRRHTSGSIELIEMPGNHVSMLQGENSCRMALAIRGRLTKGGNKVR